MKLMPLNRILFRPATVGRAEVLGHRPMLATYLIFMLSLAATLLSTWATHRATGLVLEERFKQSAERISAEIREMLTPYSQLLHAAAGLYNTRGELMQSDWDVFIKAISLQDAYPGLQGIGFSKVIPADELPAHIAAMRVNRPGYQITPAEPRDFYTSIVVLSPPDKGNERAIGYDMFTEPRRRAAMIAARDNGEAALSEAVVLVQSDPSQQQAGALYYQPVYTTRDIPSDLAARRSALAGWIYAAFRMQEFFDASVRPSMADLLKVVGLRVVGKGVLADDIVLFRAEAVGTEAPWDDRHQREVALNVLGQNWIVQFNRSPEFETTYERWLPWFVLVTGGLISCLITAVAAVLVRSRMRMVADMRALEFEVDARREAQHALEAANLQIHIANQELVHRVKNMMAVVSSIATQTARFTPNPIEFNAVFRDRLAALGRVHDFLRPNAGFRPDVRDLVPEILSPYIAEGRKLLEIDGAPQEISQNIAVMLSIVINELGANAVRYGAWSAPGGQVKIGWTRSARDGEVPVSLSFIWLETGGPTTRAPAHSGFGNYVIRFSIERGLKGTFEQDFRDSGLVCKWTIPLEAVSGPTFPDRVY